jgi:peptide/nickel transport system ATP-binding protein
MYAGKIVELADTYSLFGSPLHPYTQALLESIPKLGEKKHRLPVIPGEVPNPLDFPTGCRFHPRCKYATDICREKEPLLEKHGNGHLAACWHIDKALSSLAKET